MTAFEIIRATIGEFDDVSDGKVKAFISLSEPALSRKRFGKVYEQALAYHTAHKMKMSGLGKRIFGDSTIADSVGVSSVSEGETTVSFTNNQADNKSVDAEYAFTTYGLQFLQLRRVSIVTIVAAGVR